MHGIIHVSFYDLLPFWSVLCVWDSPKMAYGAGVYSFSLLYGIPCCQYAWFPTPSTQGKDGDREVSQLSHTDKTVVGTFTVHSNTKGEMLQDPRLMEGSPIKISTLVFPRLYCFPTLVPSPMKPLKQNLRVTFPCPLTFVDFLLACQFRKCI